MAERELVQSATFLTATESRLEVWVTLSNAFDASRPFSHFSQLGPEATVRASAARRSGPNSTLHMRIPFADHTHMHTRLRLSALPRAPQPHANPVGSGPAHTHVNPPIPPTPVSRASLAPPAASRHT